MSVELHPSEVDWADVYRVIGLDPHEPINGQHKLVTAVTLSDQVPVDNETDAAEFVADALERDGLSRTDEGYVIDEYASGTVDETDDDDGGEYEPEPEPVDETIDDQEIAKLRDKVARLEAKNRQLDQVITLLLGNISLSEIEPDELPAMLDQLRSLDDRLTELENDVKQQAAVTERTVSKPDERAQRLRQKLVDLSDDDGSEVALTRDRANVVLNNIHRGSVIDAMKRAADGRRAADDDRPYSPIEGSSNLSPVDAIRFDVGEAREAQSRIVFETDNLTGSDFRQNLMTGGE
jgi:hypothetical protein